MEIQVSCPHCDVTLEVSSQYAGKRLSCGSCGGAFVVPGGGAPGAPGPGPAAPKPRRRTSPQRGGPRRAPAPRGAGRAGRGAPGHPRRGEDEIAFEEEIRPYAPRQRSMLGFQLGLLAVAVVAVIVLVVAYGSRDKDGLFSPDPDEKEEVREDWTETELEKMIIHRSDIESSYRATFYNEYKLPDRDPKRTMYRDKRQEYKDYLISEVRIAAPGANERMVRQVVERVLSRWEQDEFRKIREDPPERQGPGYRRPSAVEREDRRIDEQARDAVDRMIKDVTVPGDYAARAQWLKEEMIVLRVEAVEEGYNLNRYAVQVARLEQLWYYFKRWSQPHERSLKSYVWAESVIREMGRLRDRWRAWSAGKDDSLTPEDVESALRAICKDLKQAETVFVYD